MLEQYEGKEVKIVAKNGKTFYGFAVQRLLPFENDEECESLLVENKDGGLVEFLSNKIDSIAVI